MKRLPRWSHFLPLLVLVTVNALPLAAQDKKRDSLSLKELERTDIIDFGARLLTPRHPDDQHHADANDRVQFSIIPVAPASSSGGVSVSAINASFFVDKGSNLSTVYFYPYTNFSTSYGILLSPYIWAANNEWNATGDFRVIYNDLRDYGLGGTAPVQDYTIIEHSQIRTYLAAHTRVLPNFYLGVGYNLDYFFGVEEDDPTPETPSEFRQHGYGTGPTTVSSGITFNLLRDNRKNSSNPTNGYFTALVFKVNRKAMGSSTEWGSVFFDVRRYLSFSSTRHKILAGRAFYWGTFGDVPYLNLPATFEEPTTGRAGRGYLTNRFRGAHWVYGEAEYRFDVSHRGFFGATVFTNLQSYTNAEGRFDKILPAAGMGLRFKFNRKSDINLTVDFAYGKDGWNWYVNLGEYF
jgi:hypothetical protein